MLRRKSWVESLAERFPVFPLAEILVHHTCLINGIEKSVTNMRGQDRSRASKVYHMPIDRGHLWQTVGKRFEGLGDLFSDFVITNYDHRRTKGPKIKEHESSGQNVSLLVLSGQLVLCLRRGAVEPCGDECGCLTDDQVPRLLQQRQDLTISANFCLFPNIIGIG